jgi:ribosomal protein S18 acetylase RimI-like enzyme
MQPDVDPRRVAAVAATVHLPSGVQLRPWTVADFDAVQALSTAAGWVTLQERPTDGLQAWTRSWPALVVVHKEQVIGFLRAISDGIVTTYVAELLVAPAWRQEGLATALLEAAQRLVPGSRLDLLATGASRGFYERLGFRRFFGFRTGWGEREARAAGGGAPSADD